MDAPVLGEPVRGDGRPCDVRVALRGLRRGFDAPVAANGRPARLWSAGVGHGGPRIASGVANDDARTLHGESWHVSWQGSFWSISPANPFQYSFPFQPLPTAAFCRHFPPSKTLTKNSFFDIVSPISPFMGLLVSPFKDPCKILCF